MHNFGIRQICILRLLHQPGQVFIRVKTVLNSRLDQAEHNCAAGGSLWCVSEQEVLPVNDEGLNASLGTVVGDLQSAVFQIVGQVRPLLF